MRYAFMEIPVDLVPDVARLIEAFEKGRAQMFEPRDESGREMINGWTDDLVRQAFRESADPMRAVLLFLADHGGHEVTSIQIAEAIDAERGWNTVAGMLGAFGRRSANRYKRPLPMWETREGTAGTLLRMPVAVAAVIKAVANEGE